MANWNFAISVLEDALKHRQQTNGSSDVIYKMLADAYLSVGCFDEALAAYLRYSEGSHNRKIAEVYLLSSIYPKAIKEYKESIRLLDFRPGQA
jgi:tetratricopeptide (TPR) repeat protein